MTWSCDKEIKEITFKYNTWRKGYYCYINVAPYAWETGVYNAGPWETGVYTAGSWDWLRKGYTIEFSEWCDWR